MVELHSTCHACRSVSHTQGNPGASLWISAVDMIPGSPHFEAGAHRARGSLIFRAFKDDPPHMCPHQVMCSTSIHFHSRMPRPPSVFQTISCQHNERHREKKPLSDLPRNQIYRVFFPQKESKTRIENAQDFTLFFATQLRYF